jgi:Lipoxygenase
MMNRLNIQSIQQRFPWIMWPLTWVDALLTPRRWTAAFEGGARRMTSALTADTTPLVRTIVAAFGWLSSIRRRVLADRPVLMRIAWRVRQLVWSATWAFIVTMRLWPRRVRVPQDDTSIRLIPAPHSYGDFRSPTLVVPSDVPRAEMTLPGAITVQFLHLLQDVYPIIASHQPLAAADPEQRLKDAYSWIYRMVRTPPTWHSDLAQARREGNLLGALAVGGPFAKLVERTTGHGNGSNYLIDLEYLRRYPVRRGLAQLGCQIHFAEKGGSLLPTAVDYNGERATPGDTRWEFLQRIALCSLATHTTVWRHGMQYHVGGVAPFAVLTHQLPPAHPLRRLLAPHIADTLSTNYHTHLTLRRSGFDVTGFSFTYDTILRYYDDGANYFDISRLDPRLDTNRRGVAESVEYPYLRQACRYLDLFELYVREYVDHYYPDEASLAQDVAAQIWFDSLDRHIVHGIKSYAPTLTKANLVKLCAVFIYTVSVEHEDNTMWNYATFLPATVREDGGGESVGQVQAILNFEMVIASAANKLMIDSSHVALDPQGAAIMKRFQSRLRALQQQMEAEPSRHWQIHPKSLEASISA